METFVNMTKLREMLNLIANVEVSAEYVATLTLNRYVVYSNNRPRSISKAKHLNTNR